MHEQPRDVHRDHEAQEPRAEAPQAAPIDPAEPLAAPYDTAPNAPGPYAAPYATPFAAGPEPSKQARRTRFVVAVAAATALAAGVGGVAAGYAVGHQVGGTTPAASSGTANAADGGGGGVQTIPGSGWTFSDGGNTYGDGSQGLPDGTDPNGSSGTDTSTRASGSQLTGLVRISTTLKYDQASAAGTGMVLTSNGEVVTNHHVVAGSTTIRATVMSTGKTYTAKVVGTDAKDDVAVLQLTGASDLKTVTTDADGVNLGDKVTAVGDANGTVDHLSAATGTVTALQQSITTQAEGSAASERLAGLIQISSDVISGDSGGATYDDQGEVIGMTTAASSGGDVDGYAIPISKVMGIVDDLEGGVQSTRYDYGYPAFLGIGLSRTGSTVAGVYQGTPAAAAGMSAGDRITQVAGKAVSTATQVHDALGSHSPGDRVSLTWVDTSGNSHTETLTLATGPVA